MFKESEKSTFSYWFAHWCSFQLTALNLHSWKFKYLFHDAEKPWLKLFLPYEKVRNFHRNYSKHHLEYRNPFKIDWEALVIDWECSRFTKEDAPLTALETYKYRLNKENEFISDLMKKNIPKVLEKFNLKK